MSTIVEDLIKIVIAKIAPDLDVIFFHFNQKKIPMTTFHEIHIHIDHSDFCENVVMRKKLIFAIDINAKLLVPDYFVCAKISIDIVYTVQFSFNTARHQIHVPNALAIAPKELFIID